MLKFLDTCLLLIKLKDMHFKNNRDFLIKTFIQIIMIIIFIFIDTNTYILFAQKSQSSQPSKTKKPSATQLPRKTYSSNLNVSKLFAKAQKLYLEENYIEAIKIYNIILQKYPKHEPSIIQYAKSLYKLDRLQEAYMMFLKTNLNTLDIETTYEYGLTCFWQKNYALAYTAFKKIPREHPLSDLSNYYGGIAALNLNYLEDAEAMMEKAVVLPDNLEKSKKLHLKYIKELKLIKEKEYLKNQLKKEQQKRNIQKSKLHNETIINKKDNDITQSNILPSTPQKAQKKDPLSSGFFQLEKSTHISYEYQDELYDIYGYATNHFKAHKIHFYFYNGPQLNFKLNKKLPTANFATQFKFGLSNIKKQGSEQRNIQFDKTEDIVRVIATEKTNDNINSLYISIAPFIQIPLAQNIWGGLLIKGFRLIPDINAKDTSSTIETTAYLGKKSNLYTTQFQYNYVHFWLNQAKAYQELHQIYLITNIWFNSTNIQANLNHEYIRYLTNNTDGPDSTSVIGIIITQDFPLNLKLGIHGNMRYLNSFIRFNLDPYEKISANGFIFASQIFGEFSILNRLIIKASQSWQSYKWYQITPPEAKNTFEVNQYNYYSQTNIQLILNALF